jgi:hypothetical protein
VGPHANILNATADSRRDGFIKAAENKIVPSLPDIPSNGSCNGGVLKVPVTLKKQVVEAEGGWSRVFRLESFPGLSSSRAAKKKMVDVLIQGAYKASRRIREKMPEPSRVGAEATMFCKPAENLTLQRSRTPPDRIRKLVNLQMPKRIGIEIFV